MFDFSFMQVPLALTEWDNPISHIFRSGCTTRRRGTFAPLSREGMWRRLFRPAFWLARPPPCCSTRRTLSTLADRSRSCPYLNARIDATAGANADRDNALATERLLAADVRRLWHPYTSATQPVPCLAVSHASGVTLTLEDGRELIDGMSSWWAAVHGYAVPELDEAASQQLGSMAHVMFGGLTHRPAVRLAELLVQVTPEPLQRVFLCDSGSIAVEVAIKMALQYWRARGIEGRSRLLTVRGGYHGDTFGAMAVCDPVNGMHVEMFGGVLAKHLFAPRPAPLFGQPCAEKDVEEFATMLREHEHELAAVILEPIVQGAGGMHFYSADYLRRVRELCDKHGRRLRELLVLASYGLLMAFEGLRVPRMPGSDGF